MTPPRAVGVMLPRDLPASEVVPFARRAEALGFDELWVVEDLGYRGGIAQAATVLATTTSIVVGIGILPAAVRSAAFAAMELATLEQLHPGRTVIGIGHGMPDWMRSVGVWPDRPLSFLRDHVTTVTRLLRGEPAPGGQAGDLVLAERPATVPPILLGVRGPRSLAAAGEVADGVVLAEPATPAYIAHARGLIGGAAPRIVTYDLAAVAADPAAAQAVVRPALAVLALPDWRPHLVGLPYADELLALAERTGGGTAFTDALPRDWIADLTLSGTAADVRRAIAARHDAGATSVVLSPLGADRTAALEELGAVLAD